MQRPPLVLASLVLIPSIMITSALAAPNPSGTTGTIQKGSTVTITGAQFGTRPSPAPYRWMNFDDMTTGQGLPSEGASGFSTASTIAGYTPKVSTDYVRYSGSKSVLQDLRNGNYNSTIELASYPYTKMYFSGWMRGTIGPSTSRNFKMFQYRAGELDQAVWEARFGADYTSTHQYISNCDMNALNPAKSVYPPQNNWYCDGGWHRWEAYMDQGTANGNNGTWYIDVDGQRWTTLTGNFMTTSCPWNHWWLFFYYSNDNGSSSTIWATFYWDELYVDSSRARVELGDAPTWAACTHREIQPSTSWTDLQITVSANPGTLPSGSTAYLYVVDSTGTPSASGLAVTVGGGAADPGPPGQPGQPHI